MHTDWVSAGLAPGPGSGPPPPPPCAQAVLQSRPRGSARPPSPRLRLRRARPRLPLPPQLRLGASRLSGSAAKRLLRTLSPGSRGLRAPRASGCRGGRAAGAAEAREPPRRLGSPRWAKTPGGRGGAETPRPRAAGWALPLRLVRSSSRGAAESGTRRSSPGSPQEAPRPGAGWNPGRPAGYPEPGIHPRPQLAQTWAHGAARRAAGPAKFASRWSSERRANSAPKPPGRYPEIAELGARTVELRRAARPRHMPPAKLEEKQTSAPGRLGPLC